MFSVELFKAIIIYVIKDTTLTFECLMWNLKKSVETKGGFSCFPRRDTAKSFVWMFVFFFCVWVVVKFVVVYLMKRVNSGHGGARAGSGAPKKQKAGFRPDLSADVTRIVEIWSDRCRLSKTKFVEDVILQFDLQLSSIRNVNLNQKSVRELFQILVISKILENLREDEEDPEFLPEEISDEGESESESESDGSDESVEKIITPPSAPPISVSEKTKKNIKKKSKIKTQKKKIKQDLTF